MGGSCDEKVLERRKYWQASCNLTLRVLRWRKEFMIVSCDRMSSWACLCVVSGFRQEGFPGLSRIVLCFTAVSSGD